MASLRHDVVPVDPEDATIVELARQSQKEQFRVTTDAVHRAGDLDAWRGAPPLERSASCTSTSGFCSLSDASSSRKQLREKK